MLLCDRHYHVELLRVEEDEDGDLQAWHADENENDARLEDVIESVGECPQTVTIDGLDGAWVIHIFPYGA